MRNCTPSRLRISATTAAAFSDAPPPAHRAGLHGCPPAGLGRPDGSISSRLGRAWPVGYSRGMIHALVLSALLLAPAPAGADEALWALLRGGGQVIVLHAAEPLGARAGRREGAP